MPQTRNSPCKCGSGRKFKHCHGSLSFDNLHSHVSDDVLSKVLHSVDDENLAKGLDPSNRSFQNVSAALDRLNIDGVVLVGPNAPPIVHRIHRINDLLFRAQDKRAGGVHLGAFMFRDIFCRFDVPIIFGSPEIDFVSLADLSEYQKRWLFSDDNAAQSFEDQAIDLLDFGYGWMEFGHGQVIDPRGKELIFRSHIQLEAAAATATGPCDFRGTVQSALLASELALKAGLAASGIDDENLKKVGHDWQKAADELHKIRPEFDVERINRVASTFPNFVKSRYFEQSKSRMETGHILMGAQYIASEVTRLFSDRNHRKISKNTRRRVYPQ